MCGDTNYPASMGGPNICPSCDCGIDPKVKKLEAQLASLRAENSKLRENLDAPTIHILRNWDVDKIRTFALHLLGDKYQEQSARITQLEGALKAWHKKRMTPNSSPAFYGVADEELAKFIKSISKPSSSMEVTNEKG